MKEMRNSYNIFGEKPEGKRQLGRYKHKCDNNIVMCIGD
jgi:hypothetical protein